MHGCIIFHVITNLMNVILIWQGPPGRDGLRGFKGYKVRYWHFFFFFARCFNLLLLSEIAWNVLFVIFLENYFLNQYFLREKMLRFFISFVSKVNISNRWNSPLCLAVVLWNETLFLQYFYSNKSDHNNFDCCFLREMLECLVVSVHKEIRYWTIFKIVSSPRKKEMSSGRTM